MVKVLMVDDSPLLLKIARSQLEKGGFSVIEAHDGQEAVHMAQAEKPDLIFLDAEMPVMDGLEACGIIKKDPSTQNIPIYMYSGHDMQGEELRLFTEAGADGCLKKPYKPEEMYAIIKKVTGSG